MEVAYKYCDRHGAEILKTLELKITPPNEFNDPFEFFPRVICSNPRRRAKQIVKTKRHLKGFYDLEKAEGWFVGNYRDYRRFAKEKRDHIVKWLASGLLSAADQSRRELLDRVSQRCGILCLSKTRESILMWGHYCDKHQGIVIGFNASHPAFNRGVSTHLVPVQYVREGDLFFVFLV